MVSLNISDLVNADASLISRRCWSDEGVYVLEKRGIFGKSWLFLGMSLRSGRRVISCKPICVKRQSFSPAVRMAVFTPISTAARIVGYPSVGLITAIPSGLFAPIIIGHTRWKGI